MRGIARLFWLCLRLLRRIRSKRVEHFSDRRFVLHVCCGTVCCYVAGEKTTEVIQANHWDYGRNGNDEPAVATGLPVHATVKVHHTKVTCCFTRQIKTDEDGGTGRRTKGNGVCIRVQSSEILPGRPSC